MVNSGSSREHEAMHFYFAVWPSWRPGTPTSLPCIFQAQRELGIPAAVVDVIVGTKPDWTVSSWMQLWNSSLETV